MTGPVHVNITLSGSPGRAKVAYVVSCPGRPSVERSREIDGAGTLMLGPNESADEIRATPVIDGYWTGYVKVNGAAQIDIDCPPIVHAGPIDWWHAVHGIVTSDATRGGGVRIGVIDHSLGDQRWMSSVVNLMTCYSIIGGAKLFSVKQSDIRHGQDICLLIGAHPTIASGCMREGVAPGAWLHFVAAADPGTDKLAPDSVGLAIGFLSEQIGCDLIVLSCGQERPSQVLRSAIDRARDFGSLCICAAGNSNRLPLFPARLDKVVGVTALGKSGVAPPQTLGNAAAAAGGLARSTGQQLFAWESSARGAGVDAIAAGVSVISPAGRGFDLDGTSYAAPILSGILAVSLALDGSYMATPRTPARADMALARLKACCQDEGFSPALFGYGVPRC